MPSPVRIILVGCGGYAGYHAAKLAAHADARLVACVDLSPAIVAAFLAKHVPQLNPAPAFEADLADAIRRHRADAVLIATPHALHFAHAITALDAGCHVYIEKPMVIHAADARILKRRVDETDRVLVVGYNTPCTPEFDYLRRVIADPHGPSGLGNLQLVTGFLAQNWMRWTAGTWRRDPALSGGGAAFDTGAHLLNSLCWAVESRVAEVFAMIDKRGCEVDVNSIIAIRFRNGILANLAIAGDCPSDASRLTFLFAGGRIDIDGWYGSWIEVHNAYGKVKYPKINADQPGQSALDNFIDAVLGRHPPRATAAHGVIQAELMEAMYESARRGEVVRVAP